MKPGWRMGDQRRTIMPTRPQTRSSKRFCTCARSNTSTLRIAWYLECYHGTKLSDDGVHRILCRYSLNRLPGGTWVRKTPTARYSKQAPGRQLVVFEVLKSWQGGEGAGLPRRMMGGDDHGDGTSCGSRFAGPCR